MISTLSQSLWSGHCNLWRHGLTLKLIFLSFSSIWTLFWIELLKWWSRDGDQERQGKGVSWRTNGIFIICLDWILQTYLGMNFILPSEFAKAIFSRWVKARLRKTKIKFELTLKPIFFCFSFWIKHSTKISLIEIKWQPYYRIIIINYDTWGIIDILFEILILIRQCISQTTITYNTYTNFLASQVINLFW